MEVKNIIHSRVVMNEKLRDYIKKTVLKLTVKCYDRSNQHLHLAFSFYWWLLPRLRYWTGS